jgi:hypothetical protein
MPREKLIPKPVDETKPPRERFNQLASRVFSVPKSEIDKREKEWQSARKKR